MDDKNIMYLLYHQNNLQSPKKLNQIKSKNTEIVYKFR